MLIPTLVAEARALYFASTDEHEKVDCFFDFQETKDLPIKKQYPNIECLVSTHTP